MRGLHSTRRWGLPAALLALSCGEAAAHASDRGHVLLLPTGYYLFGGAVAVALSFAVLAFVPPRTVAGLAGRRLRLGSVPAWMRLPGSVLSLLLFLGLVAIGLFGSRDPLSNPTPLVFWTVFWIGLTLLQGLTGNLWWWINPWYAPHRALTALLGRKDARELPVWLGYWPAIVQFLGFAWFELVYPAPDDPARLAIALAAYFLINLAAMLAFGYEAWTRQGECLSAFLRMIGRLGVVEAGEARDGQRTVSLRLPGAKLVEAETLPLSGVLFLLLALGSVSFDGLMRTFYWLDLNGINPLEYPGRTALIGISSYGLVLTFAVLTCAFLAAVALGGRLAGDRIRLIHASGLLVWSIVPISMAYHFSHYLTALAVNIQYTIAALSDPLSTGADLFGTADMHIHAGVVAGAESAWLIWNLQAAAIIGGHLLAVAVAHAIAFRLTGSASRATMSQLPLAVLMVLYTIFGLWLLSSPTAG